MNKLITTIMTVGLFMTAMTSTVAQKVAYTNSQIIFAELPATKEAQSNIETLQKQLEKQGQNLVTAFQTKLKDLQDKQQRGELAPKQAEVEQENLRQEEIKIAKFQQDSQIKIRDKQEALLKPIRDQIQGAIDAIAKEGGYVYVFDQAVGVLLYADESTDITAQVKSKLGIQ